MVTSQQITWQLICVFVFAYTINRFSHVAAQIAVSYFSRDCTDVNEKCELRDTSSQETDCQMSANTEGRYIWRNGSVTSPLMSCMLRGYHTTTQTLTNHRKLINFRIHRVS